MRSIDPQLAPSRPVLHLSTPAGWLNDPNGLCFRDGMWHAFYQHDPSTNVHGTMHWGHAVSTDLRTWRHRPIALEPDELGEIFSGSVVIDHHDTAGFGAGAMVAIFTHHDAGRQRQSIAHSLDGGVTWSKFAGNPVLESDAADFRDPKVVALETAAGSTWIMCLAAGQEIEFYRSDDLRSWVRTGAYSSTTTPQLGTYECPDLLAPSHAGEPWTLTFCAIGAGPHGHSGTLAVTGSFDGAEFVPSGAPVALDHGPDFYAAQTFFGAPDRRHVALAWMNSWTYSTTHPSTDWRGMLTLPRSIELDPAGGGSDGVPIVRSTPAVDLSAGALPLEALRWKSHGDRALRIVTRGDTSIALNGLDDEPLATITIDDRAVRLTRHQAVAERFAETYEAPVLGDGDHEIVIDHGTIEVFAASGSSTLSALVFPGPSWSVAVDGDASMQTIGILAR